MLEGLIDSLLATLLQLGYPGIVVLMAMESSVLPVPSELIMPPAGYWAAKGEMNFALAVVCGTVGSILGALANYFGAHWLGRPFLQRFGKYFFLSEKALERSERFFSQHGEISTLIGRLLPVVRHLISIPAGVHRMPLPKFIAYTGLGAAVWCTILTWIGYVLGRNEGVLRSEEVQRRVAIALWILVPVLIAGVVIYVLRHRRKAQG
jgi:membrane protein DedA with SNARE-associated domain